MNRLNQILGNDGQEEPSSLLMFIAYYKFRGRTFSITIYEQNWQCAENYCREHNMELSGKLEKTYKI